MAQSALAQPAAAGDDPAYLQVELGDHAGPVRRIAVDAQRGLVVTGADDKTARTWSLDSGELQRVLRPPVGPLELGRVYGVALHPLQPWVAVGGTSADRSRPGSTHWMYVYDAVSGAPVRRFDARGGDVKRLLWSADGTLLIAAYAGDHAVRAFDAHGKMVFEDRFSAGVYALARSEQGRLAAAALDGTLRVYDLAGGKPVQRAQRTTPGRNPVSLAFSPDGGTLAVGYFLPGKTPDLIAWESGASQSLPAPAGMQSENLMAVAWSAHDGRVIAAGTHGYSARKVPLVFYNPAARSVSETRVVAQLSVTDLVPLADGRVAYAASDGAWGVSGARPLARPPRLPQLLRADDVRVSADGSRLSWPLQGGGERVTFDLARRALAHGEGSELSGPKVRRGLFDAPTEWENLTTPRVNGARIALHDDEVSRAVALFAHGKDAALGTSRALYRIGPHGQVMWRVTTPTEVRAVLVTREDRLIVTAMLDGTIRLWRSSDGTELLTLLVLRDGRWVMWTTGGFFDASVGADSLVGWVINRAPSVATDGAHADYFPVARLRQRFHQPRFIDRVLESLDFAAAAQLHRADLEREAAAAASAKSAAAADANASGFVVLAPALPPPVPSAPRIEQMPPVLIAAGPTELRIGADVEARGEPRIAAAGTAAVPFAVATKTPLERLAFEARVDGRPARIVAVALPSSANGRALGRLRIDVPPQATRLQVLARDHNGFSEPLSFVLVWPASTPLQVASLPPPASNGAGSGGAATPSVGTAAPPAAGAQSSAPASAQSSAPASAHAGARPGAQSKPAAANHSSSAAGTHSAPAAPAKPVTAAQSAVAAAAHSTPAPSANKTLPAAQDTPFVEQAPANGPPSALTTSTSVSATSVPATSVSATSASGTSASGTSASASSASMGPASAPSASTLAAAAPRTQEPVAVPPRLPRLFVLAVGISEYARTEYTLGLAAKDARDFAAALRAQQGKFYREVTTRVLVNQEARRDAVRDALKWLAGAAGKDDVTMLFIAGHGLNASSGKYYFLPHDGRDEDLAATAVAEDEIRAALRTVAGRAVLFVDTCFAGNVVGALKNRNRELSRFVNDLASAENGVVVFASSSGRQLSEESEDWGNGAFTRALLQGLAGGADLLRSGQVTYKGLDYFVSQEVKRLTNGRQTPVSLSPWGVPDFALAGI